MLDVTEVRSLGGPLEVDWNLRGCEFNQCPGAPAPVTCPTATPFHVFRAARTGGEIRTVQHATIGVCP